MGQNALIGYTGFVGGNLANQNKFDCLYNSKNIEEIYGKDFDLVVCAAAPGTKWLANKEPEKDLATIERLQNNLQKITAKKFVLISTIDVYSPVIAVNEDSEIDIDKLSSYGKHRLMLENFVRSNFESLTIRLPGIFGKGIKKNILFDLINNSYQPTNGNSTYQFYYLDKIWKDVEKCMQNNLKLVNFATEPISVNEIIKIFNVSTVDNQKTLSLYDMQTKYSNLWGSAKPYLYDKNQVLEDIKNFANLA